MWLDPSPKPLFLCSGRIEKMFPVKLLNFMVGTLVTIGFSTVNIAWPTSHRLRHMALGLIDDRSIKQARKSRRLDSGPELESHGVRVESENPRCSVGRTLVQGVMASGISARQCRVGNTAKSHRPVMPVIRQCGKYRLGPSACN